MTKKSMARQQRDAVRKESDGHLKDNVIWDDLKDTYTACTQALGQHAAMAAMLKRKEVFPYLKDSSVTVSNIQSLTRDLKSLSEELLEIYKQHQDKSGGSDDPDEVIRSIQIFEQYHLFLQRQSAVIMPTAYHILEDFGQAEIAFNEAVGAIKPLPVLTDAVVDDSQPVDVAFRQIEG